MLKEKIVEMLGEKIIDRLVELGLEQRKGLLSEKKKEAFLNTYREELDENLLKQYGDEQFYDALCKALLTNRNLAMLLSRCDDRDLYDYETTEEFLNRIIESVDGSAYNKSMLKSIIAHIEKTTFESFNQLSDPEHISLKNIFKMDIDKVLHNMNDNSKKIIEEYQKSRENDNYHKNTTCNGSMSAIDITWGCKNPVKHFLGRDIDIQSIKDIIYKDSIENEKTALWIYGMGGMGKTQLCRKLYSILKMQYEYIGWVSYQGDFKQALVNSISELERTGELEEDYKKIIKYLNSCGRQLLLFIDNYDKNNDCIDDIESLQCHVIVTSRNRNPDTFTGYELNFLDFKDCKELFRKFYTLEDNMIMNEIIHKTGYLALAVELVAKTGQKLALPLQEYYQKLEQKGFDIQTVIESNWDNNGEKLNVALSKHFGIVFDLTSFKTNSEAIYILKNFSLLPYLGIEHSKTIDWLKLSKEDNMLNELVESGWLQRTSDFEYMMHPIISYTVKCVASPIIKECTNMVNALVQSIVLEAGSNYLLVFKYLPYATTVGEYFVNRKTIDSASVLIWLYIRLAEIYRQNGEYSKALKWGEQANNLMIYIDNSKEKGILGNLLYNIISEIFLDMRNHNDKCKEWALRAIDSDKDHADGLDDIKKSTSYHNLASAYIQLGENEKALDNEMIAVSLRKNNLPEMDVRVLNAYRNLAMIFRRLKMIEDAYYYQNKVVVLLGRIHENEKIHPDFPVAYSLYSFILKDMGKIDEAIDYQKKAMEIREKINVNDPKLAINYNNLGMFYLANKKLEEAEIWQNKAIEMDLKNRDKDHPDLALDYFNYAKILEALGKYTDAIKYLQLSRNIEVKNSFRNVEEIDRMIVRIKDKKDN